MEPGTHNSCFHQRYLDDSWLVYDAKLPSQTVQNDSPTSVGFLLIIPLWGIHSDLGLGRLRSLLALLMLGGIAAGIGFGAET